MFNYVMGIDHILINIFKYLDIKELFSISNVSKKFNNIIMCKKVDGIENRNEYYNTGIYDYFDLSYNEPDIYPENGKKIISIIKNSKHLKKLSLTLCENLKLGQDIIKNVNSKEVKRLYISLATFKTSKDLAKFSESLTELSVKNIHFNEVGIEYNILMVENIILLKNLKKNK